MTDSKNAFPSESTCPLHEFSAVTGVDNPWNGHFPMRLHGLSCWLSTPQMLCPLSLYTFPAMMVQAAACNFAMSYRGGLACGRGACDNGVPGGGGHGIGPFNEPDGGAPTVVATVTVDDGGKGGPSDRSGNGSVGKGALW